MDNITDSNIVISDNIQYPSYFYQCFDMKNIKTNIRLREYFRIINYRKINPSNEKYRERHHIVPKSWFRMNNIKVITDNDNIVYLSIREHLKVHVLLTYYFKESGNNQMYGKMLNAIHVMTNMNSQQLLYYGDIPKEVYDEYQKLREEYYRNNKNHRKYGIDYLWRCFEIYNSYDDGDYAFEQVRKIMNFPYDKKRTLEDQFRKYIPQEKCRECFEKHMKFAVEKYNEYRRNKSIERQRKLEQEKEIRKIDDLKNIERTKEELKIKYDEFCKFGPRFMIHKYGSFHQCSFIDRCERYGIVEKRIKRNMGRELNIEYNGQVDSLVGWVRKLGIKIGDYHILSKLHSRCGIEYPKLFDMYKTGEYRNIQIPDKSIDQERNLPYVNLEKQCKFLKINFIQLCELMINGKSEDDAFNELLA